MELFAINFNPVTQFILKHFRVANDGIQRRSQLMAHIGEEHAFRGVSRVGIGTRRVHLLDRDLQF